METQVFMRFVIQFAFCVWYEQESDFPLRRLAPLKNEQNGRLNLYDSICTLFSHTGETGVVIFMSKHNTVVFITTISLSWRRIIQLFNKYQ